MADCLAGFTLKLAVIIFGSNEPPSESARLVGRPLMLRLEVWRERRVEEKGGKERGGKGRGMVTTFPCLDILKIKGEGE